MLYSRLAADCSRAVVAAKAIATICSNPIEACGSNRIRKKCSGELPTIFYDSCASLYDNCASHKAAQAPIDFKTEMGDGPWSAIPASRCRGDGCGRGDI
jgi:hypothetical protein